MTLLLLQNFLLQTFMSSNALIFLKLPVAYTKSVALQHCFKSLAFQKPSIFMPDKIIISDKLTILLILLTCFDFESVLSQYMVN